MAGRTDARLVVTAACVCDDAGRAVVAVAAAAPALAAAVAFWGLLVSGSHQGDGHCRTGCGWLRPPEHRRVTADVASLVAGLREVRTLRLVGVAALVVWAGPTWAQEDQLAVESSISRASVLAPPPGSNPSPAHTQGQGYHSRPPIRRQFAEILLPARPAPAARGPMAAIGQQVREYMRRISGYFRRLISGDPPITRRRDRVSQRAPPRGRPISRDYGRSPPIKGRHTPGGGAAAVGARTWPAGRGQGARLRSRMGVHSDTGRRPHHPREGVSRAKKQLGRGSSTERSRRLRERRHKVNRYYLI
ncbi:uncharacterized protein [Panulirus ornatus]|uniref:uncharacterized protein n=1 Tax=Panulirus ornatus TaxID=150431 RepID=UPI003A8B8355